MRTVIVLCAFPGIFSVSTGGIDPSSGHSQGVPDMTYPFYCMAAAFLITYLTKLPLAIAMDKESESGYDNRNPRDQQARLTGWGRRSLAAHQNGFEITPVFAAAVITAHLFQADAWWSAVWAATFVVSRILYVVFYLRDVHYMRSTVWTIGLASCVALFVLAA
jgi:uncharacterized MAPEG superfamily protein